MTERQPPLWIDGGCYTGEDLRAMFATMTPCPNGGVLGPTDMAVTAPGGLQLQVGAGGCWVPGTDQVGQGPYLCTNPDPTILTVAGADAANPRIDLVIARVYDPSYGGTGQPRWALEMVKGTPAASPQVPAAPTSSYVLAQVTVPAATPSIAAGNLTDRRTACSTGTGGSPTGTLAPFAGLAAPAGWLLANGAAVSRTLYATLFAVVGTRFGAGDGTTTFNLPNMQGRVPVGVDGSAEFPSVGAAAGTKAANMPSHNHTGAVSAADRSLNHQHSLNFWSGYQATDYNDPHHIHRPVGAGWEFVVQAGPGTGNLSAAMANIGGDRAVSSTPITLNEEPGQHHHFVSGWSDANQGGVDHLHYIAADGGGGNNLPPYLTLTYIVRY